MRAAPLLLLLLLPAQEIPAEWNDLAALASSIDPDDRDAARTALEKAAGPSKDMLRKLARENDSAAVLLGLLGDNSARMNLLKCLKSDDALLRRCAAEALGSCPGDSGISDLSAKLDDPDPGVALAASRALGRMKAKSAAKELAKAMEGSAKNERRAVFAAHGLELLEPGSQKTFLQQRLTSASLREAAYIVATNSPAVIEVLKRSIDKTFKRADDLKLVLEKDALSDPARDALGTLVIRSAILNPSDALAYLKWPATPPTPWALKRVPRLKMLHRSCIAFDLVRAIEARAKSRIDDDELAHFEAVERTLQQACGIAKPEGDFEERAKAYRAWYDRVWTSTIDGDVIRAIDSGVAWLKARQEKDGSWLWCKCGYETYANIHHAPGQTALCGYTLLKMDVAPEDPAVQKAVTYLLDIPVDKVTDDPTYSLSLQAMFLGELLRALKGKKPEKGTRTENNPQLQARVLKRIQECVDWLIEARVVLDKGGYEQYAWTYNKPAAGKTHDHSNTQFAALGLIAGQNAGAKVPAKIWQGASNHWKHTQYDEGGWYYSPFPESTPKTSLVGSVSMTGAGIASLLVSAAALKNTATEKIAASDDGVKKAVAKWDKSYPIPAVARYTAQGHVFSIYYDLYSVERAMMLGGITKLGGKDWYHDGALYILWNQMHDGAWLDTSDTCFALLFLKKAYIPVATGGDK